MSAPLPAELIVIGRAGEGSDTSIVLQDFVDNDGRFIPLFSNEQIFRQSVQGTGLEAQGMALDRSLLVSILRGDEVLVLDPGTKHARRLTRAELG